MSKEEFLRALGAALSGLPEKEREEHLHFYSEMLEDKIEDGIPESEAVAEIGSPDKVAEQILSEISFFRIAKEKIKPKRRLSAWEIALVALGSPIWLSLIVSAIAGGVSLFATLWSLLVSAWAVFASLAGGALGGVVGCAFALASGNAPSGFFLLGAGILCAGLAIFAFFGCTRATAGTLWVTKRLALGIKKCFLVKGGAENA